MHTASRGFTLIELLISMAILGILATLGFGNFQSARLKALDAKRKSDLSTIAKSLEAYVNDHRQYPSSNGNGEILCQGAAACSWGSQFSDGTTLYAATLPTDPGSNAYRYVSTNTSFTLYARLSNPNDPAIVDYSPTMCGSLACNYKITSSNIQ